MAADSLNPIIASLSLLSEEEYAYFFSNEGMMEHGDLLSIQAEAECESACSFHCLNHGTERFREALGITYPLMQKIAESHCPAEMVLMAGFLYHFILNKVHEAAKFDYELQRKCKDIGIDPPLEEE